MTYEGSVDISLLHKYSFPNEDLFICRYKSGKIYEDLSTKPLILMKKEYTVNALEPIIFCEIWTFLEQNFCVSNCCSSFKVQLSGQPPP